MHDILGLLAMLFFMVGLPAIFNIFVTWSMKITTTAADLKPALPKTYTQEEVDRLVLEEREKCARIADGYAVHTTNQTNQKINQLAEDIRNGGFKMRY